MAEITTEDVKRAHRNFRVSAFRDHSETSDAEFDAWLARIRAEAWDEGHRSSVDIAAVGWRYEVVARDPQPENPYHAEASIRSGSEEDRS